MPALPSGVRGAVITGWGTALPPEDLTNNDLEQMMDTSDEWIVERTGIRERHVGGTTVGLSIEAGRAGARHVGRRPGRDRRAGAGHDHARPPVPATSAAVQNELGLRCGAFDVNAACSGFVYGLVIAHGLIAMGAKQGAASSAPTRCPASSTGTTATRRSCSPTAPAPSCSRRSRDPASCSAGTSTPTVRLERLLYAEVGGFIHMEGKEVFRRAVRIMVDSADEVDGPRRRHRRRHRAGRAAPGQHPHHRGRVRTPRHPDGAGRRPCSTAPATPRRRRSRWRSRDALDTGRVNDGDLVLLVGFGGGMTAASAVLRWGGGAPAGGPA